MAKAKRKVAAKPAPLKLVKTGKVFTDTFEIERTGKSIVTKIGTPWSTAKEKTKTLATPDKAQAAYDKLVADKRADGFRELGEIDPPTIPTPRNPELEAAIRENRDDPGPYLVYADWLQAQGSRFGEAIVLAHRKKQKAAEAIAKKLGLPHKQLATYGWRTGFWQWLKLDNGVDSSDARWDPLPFARSLFGSPLCAVLEELRIGMLRWDGNDQPAVIAEAGHHAWAKDLRNLKVGDVDDNIDMDHHTIGDVGKVISKSFPNLVSLWLHSGSQSWRGRETFAIGGLDLPQLEALVIETCAMTSKRMKSITAANLPSLTKLELWFGDPERDATARIADVAPILTGKPFPRLRHLGLRNTTLCTDLVRLLPAGKLAPQLETLDLSMGTLYDDDAAELAETADQFRALKTLDVSDSYLTPAGIRTLKAAFKGKQVQAGEQREPYDDEDDDQTRYVSVGE